MDWSLAHPKLAPLTLQGQPKVGQSLEGFGGTLLETQGTGAEDNFHVDRSGKGAVGMLLYGGAIVDDVSHPQVRAASVLSGATKAPRPSPRPRDLTVALSWPVVPVVTIARHRMRSGSHHRSPSEVWAFRRRLLDRVVNLQLENLESVSDHLQDSPALVAASVIQWFNMRW